MIKTKEDVGGKAGTNVHLSFLSFHNDLEHVGQQGGSRCKSWAISELVTVLAQPFLHSSCQESILKPTGYLFYIQNYVLVPVG